MAKINVHESPNQIFKQHSRRIFKFVRRCCKLVFQRPAVSILDQQNKPLKLLGFR